MTTLQFQSRKLRAAAIAAMAALALAACQTVQTTQSGAVGVERKQTMMLSSAEVNRGAEQAYLQTTQEAAKKGALNRNPAEVQRVRAIANRLIPATGAFRADAPKWKWEVNVISSSESQRLVHAGRQDRGLHRLAGKAAATDESSPR